MLREGRRVPLRLLSLVETEESAEEELILVTGLADEVEDLIGAVPVLP